MRAHKLPHSTLLAIARYKEQHPATTNYVLADRFHCTYEQVREALKKDKAGALKRPPPKRTSKMVRAEIAAKTDDELLESQFKRALEQMTENKDLAVSERVKMLGDLLFARKTMQQVTLQNHMRRGDAAIIALLIRRYQPEATDDDCIKIYLETARIAAETPTR